MEDPTGIMPTCREVHRLTSEHLDRELTLVERLRVRMHLLVCGPCTIFTDQMALIRRAMRKLAAGEPPGPDGDTT
jgi:predicted anti-sigma-YlaC factor YlaD